MFKVNPILDDIPSIPRIPSVAPLHLGITTRVMAKRQEKMQQLLENARKAGISEEELSKQRRSSLFLEGASIPNSTVRGALQGSRAQGRRDTSKQERDEFVRKLVSRLLPQQKMRHSIYDENVDREALDRIKKELRNKSLFPILHNDEPDKQAISVTSSKTSKAPTDPWEELKSKRRILRTTSILAPLSRDKRPNYESIRKSMYSSKVIKQLLEADKRGIEKMKQIQGRRSVSPLRFKSNEPEGQPVPVPETPATVTEQPNMEEESKGEVLNTDPQNIPVADTKSWADKATSTGRKGSNASKKLPRRFSIRKGVKSSDRKLDSVTVQQRKTSR